MSNNNSTQKVTNLSKNFVPEATYSDAAAFKAYIFKENKGKAGVYR
jgi:hypothetical protein